MNIPTPNVYDTDAALLPPLLGTEFDAAGRILLALTALGLEVRGVAVEQEYGAPIRHFVHVIIASLSMSQAEYDAIDGVMTQDAQVAGRWWVEHDADAPEITRLAFEVG